ncbi:hypothetical protein AC23_5306 [Escherichia coli 7-233-03_S3_C2]|nr:hypothetical protein AC86_5450 [Escherichia coli 3-073-06_S4_C1]KEN31065.1 hypothetical protein AC23_5495 [Escherichia coli 7-233-03_S3_C2]KEN33164.1 hypothetical protein AC23_5306 [Escherichia coli 7-233-03_S3_C2]
MYFIVYLYEINNIQQWRLYEFYHLTLNVHFISVTFHCLLINLADK